MPRTLEMVETLLTLDTDLLARPRTQIHAHTHTCYKKGRTKCFGAPFIPSNETRIVVPFPPTEDEAGKTRRRKLKERYEQMHDALERGSFDSLEEFPYVWCGLGRRVRGDCEGRLLAPLRSASPHSGAKVCQCVQPLERKSLGFQLGSPSHPRPLRLRHVCGRLRQQGGPGVVQLAQGGYVDSGREARVADYTAVVRSLGVTMLKGVEMSAQEAAWYLLGQEMSEKSRDVVYVPTCYPEERVRVRKTKEQLVNAGAASTDVGKPNIVQKYEARPAEMEDVCLADFASKYKSGYGRREQPVVVRYRHYSASDQPQDYVREQVLLDVPFRNEVVDVLDNNKYLRLYEDNKDLIAAKRREYDVAGDDDVVAEMIREYRCRLEAEEEEAAAAAAAVPAATTAAGSAAVSAAVADEDADLLPSQDLVRLAKETSPCAAVRKRQDVMGREEYLNFMRMTNPEQYELLREIVHRQTTPGSPPLRVFLTGPADCCKTFVLKLLMDVYNR